MSEKHEILIGFKYFSTFVFLRFRGFVIIGFRVRHLSFDIHLKFELWQLKLKIHFFTDNPLYTAIRGLLIRGIENRFGPLFYLIVQFINRAEIHTGCLAVFYAGRFFTLFCPVGAEVAQIRWKRKIVNGHSIQGLQDMLVYNNAEFPCRITMFLLAGDLAGSATRTVIILDQKSAL